MNTRAARLQSILASYAPTPEAANNCDHVYSRMLSDNLSEREIERQIASAISDGLNYGNWPWIDWNAVMDAKTQYLLDNTEF